MQRWYVVEAYEGRDEDAYLRLVAAGFKAWRPVDERRSWNRNVRKAAPSMGPKRRITKIARFGRYIFLRCEETDITHGFVVSAVKNMRGVFGFVTMAGSDAPAALPEGLIEFYMSFCPGRRSANGVEIKKGMKVALVAGPLQGHAGVVADVDSRGVMRIDLNLFGRSTPIICEVGHVEAQEQGRRPPKPSDVSKVSGESRPFSEAMAAVRR
jgi:transcription antitermination factor NusG